MDYGDGPMLSHDEELGLAKVAELTHGSSSILNDPFDGSGWGHALHDLPVLFAAPVYWPELLDGWGGRSRDAVALVQPRRHLTGGTGRGGATGRAVGGPRPCVRPLGDPHRQPELTDLQNVAALTLIYDNGAVQLYRVNQPPA
jgi:hypothetical protein